MNKLSAHWQRFENKSVSDCAQFIFFIALLVRIILIFLLRPYHDLARYELERTALSLATSGIYGNPYATVTGPTAHVSPGYTVILAGLFHVFGSGTAGEIVKEVLASVVAAVGCAAIPFVSQALRITKRTGLVASLVCALLPIKPLVQIDGDWEAPYAALFLTILAATVINQWNRRDFSVSTALRLGFLWGLAVLFSSVLLPIFAGLMVCGLLFFIPSWRVYLQSGVLQGLVVLLCLLPWMIRNDLALGAPIATRSNFGLEMHVSNNDQASPDQRVNYIAGVYGRYHPLQNSAESEKVKALGEVSYNRMVLTEAKQWIAAHPVQFWKLCAGRFMCFWFYPDPSKIKALFGDLTALLGIAGLILTYRNNRIGGVVLTIILVLYPAPSYLIQVGARQRYPIDWLLTLLSVYSVTKAWNLLSPKLR